MYPSELYGHLKTAGLRGRCTQCGATMYWTPGAQPGSFDQGLCTQCAKKAPKTKKANVTDEALEQAFWEFDAERKATGAERDAFKRQLRPVVLATHPQAHEAVDGVRDAGWTLAQPGEPLAARAALTTHLNPDAVRALVGDPACGRPFEAYLKAAQLKPGEKGYAYAFAKQLKRQLGQDDGVKAASILEKMEWDPEHLARFVDAGRRNAAWLDEYIAKNKVALDAELARIKAAGFKRKFVSGDGLAHLLERCQRCECDLGDCECPQGKVAGRDYKLLLARLHARRNGLPEPPLPKQAGKAEGDKDWKTMPGVRAVVVDSDNKILLLRRPDDEEFHPGKWNLPGGAKEDGETFLNGALRELKEETGIGGYPTSMAHTFKFPGNIGKAFLMEWKKGKLKVAPREVAEVGWFHKDHLPKKLFPQTKSIINNLVKEEKKAHELYALYKAAGLFSP